MLVTTDNFINSNWQNTVHRFGIQGTQLHVNVAQVIKKKKKKNYIFVLKTVPVVGFL